MDADDLPVPTEKLVALEKKLARAAQRGKSMQFTAEEADLFAALGCYELVALAVAKRLRQLAIERIYRRAGKPLPSEEQATPAGGEPAKPKPKPVQDYAYTPATLAERWGVSPATVINRIKRGELKAFMLGEKMYRIRPEEVVAFEAIKDAPDHIPPA